MTKVGVLLLVVVTASVMLQPVEGSRRPPRPHRYRWPKRVRESAEDEDNLIQVSSVLKSLTERAVDNNINKEEIKPAEKDDDDTEKV